MTTYITSSYLSRLISQLDQTDHDLISTVHSVSMISGNQLQRVFWPGGESQKRRARRRLATLTNDRVLARLDRTIGGRRAGSEGYIYRLDIAGRRLLGLPASRGPYTPGLTFLRHRIDVTEIIVGLIETARQRNAEIGYESEPACWRPIPGTNTILKPDAYTVVRADGYEDHSYIEVDRGTEGSTTLNRKLATYSRYWRSGHDQRTHGVFPRVIWQVPHTKRHQVLSELLDQLPSAERDIHRVVLPSRTIAALFGGDT